MPMLGPHMSTAFIAVLTGNGFIGTSLPTLGLAVGVGSCDEVVGKTFATSDVGTVPGVGVGVGVGITGVVAAGVKTACIAEGATRGLISTPQSIDTYAAYGQALVAELALASLSSTHTPVFAGTGTVVPGSIPVAAGAWGSAIQSAGPTLAGSKWPDFAATLGAGAVDAFPTATGTVVIAGSPTSPTTSPGAGSGSGVIA
jgi:hypothetical protein